MLSDLFKIEDKKEHEINSIKFYNEDGVIDSFEPYTEIGKIDKPMEVQKINKLNPERKVVSYINIGNKNDKFISDIFVPSNKNCNIEFKGEIEKNSTTTKKFIYKKYLLTLNGRQITVLKLKESKLTEFGEQIKQFQEELEEKEIFIDEYTIEEMLNNYDIKKKE